MRYTNKNGSEIDREHLADLCISKLAKVHRKTRHFVGLCKETAKLMEIEKRGISEMLKLPRHMQHQSAKYMASARTRFTKNPLRVTCKSCLRGMLRDLTGK